MNQALFLNGVYKDVLEEIIVAQGKNEDLVCFLQPYKNQAIKLLKENDFAETAAIELYISITSSLNLISHVAEIVNWEDKNIVFKNKERLNILNKHILEHQPGEGEIYLFSDEEKTKGCTNLISIINLRKISNPFSTNNLIKVSDGTAYKPRTQAGGWSPVFKLEQWIEAKESRFKSQVEDELSQKVAESKKISSYERKKRIKEVSIEPEVIQVISRGFKRNADVIAEVLSRANGICEKCGSKAPFMRKKDNTPYLEVHHKTNLADGGHDTLENAMALCPNCHRELHFGIQGF